jgi:hypothetical protein
MTFVYAIKALIYGATTAGKTTPTLTVCPSATNDMFPSNSPINGLIFSMNSCEVTPTTSKVRFKRPSGYPMMGSRNSAGGRTLVNV